MAKKHAASASHLEASVRLSSRGAARLHARTSLGLPLRHHRGEGRPARRGGPRSRSAREISGHGALQHVVADRHPHDLARSGGRSARSVPSAFGPPSPTARNWSPNTDAYRVVFSEADFLPGLIVDRYNDVLSVQILTQAMDAEPVREAVVADAGGRTATRGHRRARRSPDSRTGTVAAARVGTALGERRADRDDHA